MTIELDPDPEATVKMPRPLPPPQDELEDIDPEQTLVREDWESTVIQRVAPRLEALQNEVGDEEEIASRFGWESESLLRLSRVVQARGDQSG